MKIITKKKQKELDAMFKKKLRFVARATLHTLGKEKNINIDSEDITLAENRAEQVFYADDVI